MQLGLLFHPPRPDIDPASLCDDEERRVLATLLWGKENAQKVDELAKEARVHPRKFQEIIQHLIRKHQVPVGTSMGEPYGNYLIDSDEDLEATHQLLRTRGISILVTCAALKKMHVRRYLELVQANLDVLIEEIT